MGTITTLINDIAELPTVNAVAHFDLVILGGGCAGLSLAMRLAALGPACPRTLIIEKRKTYMNDRTWCFWGRGSAAVSHLIQHHWQRISVRSGQRQVTLDCCDTPYQMISGEAFYRDALRLINQSHNIHLVLGSTLLAEPNKFEIDWQIETTEGRYTGASIVDTRPGPKPAPGAAVLWQSFSGQEIECDSDLFDPASMDLMNFTGAKARRSSNIDFNYVLPLSTRRALIEATVFSPDPLTPRHLAGMLEDAIQRRMQGRRFRVIHAESGILPMGSSAIRQNRDATYVKAGLAGGAARASTGYAFQRIQRWADRCAAAISQGNLPVSQLADPLLLKGLDSLFTSVLRSHPEIAPDLFLSLFENTETARIIRFLSDTGTIFDYASVASSLPVLPFLREIPRALTRTLQR